MEEFEGRSHVQVDQQDDEEFVHTVNLTEKEQQEQENNAEMSPNSTNIGKDPSDLLEEDMVAEMKTSEIWNLFVHQNGDWDKVGCTKKDLYNSLAAGRRGVDDLDATTTLTFLQSKLDIDPEFFYAYMVDEESRLTHLFWANGASRFDYKLFGDSLSFDSTYKTNRSLYSSRHQWADTHLRGSYFGGSTATNRCESMNAFLKRFLDEKLPLWRALQHCDHGLAALRYGELGKHAADKLSTPVLKRTSMSEIEEQFASIYTQNMFLEVRNQITHSEKYNVVRHHKLKASDICTIEKYLSKDHPKRKVTFKRIEKEMSCDCYWLETRGIPCRHVFAAMKHLHLSDIPRNIIKNRWLKECKDIYLSSPDAQRRFVNPYMISSKRYGGINSQANMFLYYCKKSPKVQQRGMELMSTLLVEMQKMVEDVGEEEKMINGAVHEVHDGIKELHPVATKGRPPQSKSSQQNSSQKSAKARICRVCKKIRSRLSQL
ncbi:hypothetical protein UlMin_010473 [Ulmus minor]